MRGRGFPPVLKRFGQHFLVDQAVLSAIAEAVGPTQTDTVIEIGAGRGALTDRLAARAGRLVAVEIDRALAAALRERYSAQAHVEIVEADFLKLDVASVVSGRFLVAGNVPYYITTPIVFRVLSSPLPERAVFLVQKEVADRMAAVPGTRSYGALSVNVQAVAKVELIRSVPPGAFRPPPDVQSAVVRLTPSPTPLVEPDEIASFRTFVQGAFGQRRKQLGNVVRALSNVHAARAAELIESAGLLPHARPETLSPRDFATLMRATRTPASPG